MAGKIVKIVDTTDELGSLVNMIPPQSKSIKLYYKLEPITDPSTYSPEIISKFLGSNYFKLSPDLYDELMKTFEEYDKDIPSSFALYTLRNNNKQMFDIFNTESNKHTIYTYITHFMEYLSSRPDKEVTVFYEHINKRIAHQINKYINSYHDITLLSLGPQHTEDIIPPFIINNIPGKYRYNIVVIGNEQTEKDIAKMLKILKKNKETSGYFNIVLFTGKVYLPSLSEPVNTRIDFVESFINNLNIASKYFMFWGKYACGDINNYIVDARRISQKGCTVYGNNTLIKNGYVCSVNMENLLIDPRNMYTYDKSRLYTSLITFTGWFIGSLSIVLNYSQQDIILTDWKNSLDYSSKNAHEYGKQFEKELSVQSNKSEANYHIDNNNQIYSKKLSESPNMNSNKSHLKAHHMNSANTGSVERFSDKDRVYNEKLSESANMISYNALSQSQHGGMHIQNDNDVNNENDEHIYSFESILNNVDNSSVNRNVSEHSSNNIMEDSETNSTSSKINTPVPNASQFGGEIVNKLKEYHHKYNKYKYKHEMLRRRIINILKRNNQIDLIDEILKYD